MIILMDAILINLAFILAFFIRFEASFFISMVAQRFFEVYLTHFITITVIKIVVYYLVGLYRNLWKYASIYELMQVVIATVVANAAVIAYLAVLQTPLPRGIYAIVVMLDIGFIGGIRFAYRATMILRKRKKMGVTPGKKKEKNILIVGAGEAGSW